MLVVLENLHLLRLKTILQYRYTALIILFLIVILSLIRVSIPKERNIDINTKEASGIITYYKKSQDKITIILKSKDKIRCTYYLQDENNIELRLGIKIKVKGGLSIPAKNTISNTFNYQ